MSLAKKANSDGENWRPIRKNRLVRGEGEERPVVEQKKECWYPGAGRQPRGQVGVENVQRTRQHDGATNWSRWAVGQERGPGRTVPQCCAPVRCHISVMGSGGREGTGGRQVTEVKAMKGWAGRSTGRKSLPNRPAHE